MVKRIKKRIEKVEAEAEPTDGPSPEDLAGGGLSAELAAADDDEFTRKTATLLQWVVDNRGMLIALAVLAVVGISAFAFMDRSKAAGSEEATAAFMAGADAYQEYVEGVLGQGVEAAPAEDLEARLGKAASAFQSTQTTYKDSPLAQLATIGLAGTHLDQGKAEDAAAGYEKVLADAQLDPMLKAIALQGKAASLESKGDKAGAIAAWQALEAVNAEIYGLTAGLEVARLQEALGKKAEARATYEKLQKDYAEALESFANRSYKGDIERGLARLGPAS